MRVIFLCIIMLLMIAFINTTCAQVKFTQMERSAVKWDLPIFKRAVPGLPGFVMTPMNFNDYIDSLGVSFGTSIDSLKYQSDTLYLFTSEGIFQTYIESGTGGGTIDSIYMRNDTIFLRDGSGFVHIQDSIFCSRITELVEETDYEFPDGPYCNEVAYYKDSLYIFNGDNWELVHSNPRIFSPTQYAEKEDIPAKRIYDIFLNSQNIWYYDGSGWQDFNADADPFNEGILSWENVSTDVVGLRSSTNYFQQWKFRGLYGINIDFETTDKINFKVDTTQLRTFITNIVSDSIGNIVHPRDSLSISGNDLSIIGSNTVTLPISPTDTTLITNIVSDSIAAIVFPRDSLAISGNNLSIIGSNTVTLPPGESSTVGDTPTLDLTLTGVNITGRVDTSLIATKYDLTLLGGGLGGSGTTNYVSKFTSGTQLGNSQIFDNGTNVGINDATPTAKLDVQGGSGAFIGLFKGPGITEEAQTAGNAENTVSVQSAGAAYFHARDVTNDIDLLFGTSATGLGFMGSMSSHGIDIRTENVQRINVSNSGLVKINNLAGTGIRAVTANNTGELGTSLLGTVSSFSSGGLSPLFTTSVANATTTPALTFSPISQTQKTFFAAPNAANGNPSFRTIQPSDIPTLNQNTTGSAGTLTTGRTISITGDLAYTSPTFNGSSNVTAAGTLATVNSNVGTFTNSTITVNGKGLVTAASSGSTVTGESTTVGDTPTLDLSLTGFNITGRVDTSLIATKYDLTLLGDGLGGSGTTNYVSKFTSGTQLSNSQIFDNGTNVGINDATPTAKLDVQGGTGAFIALFKENGTTEETQASGNAQETVSLQASGNASYHVREVDNNVDAMFGVNGTNGFLGTASSHSFDFYTGNNQRMSISNGGILKVNSLAGIGVRGVTASSDGTFGTGLFGTVSSIATTSPITGGPITTTGTIGIQNATALQTGALTASDWTTFNNKMSSWNIAASGSTGSQAVSNGNTVNIVAGTGISATRTGYNVTITNTGGSGTVTSIGTNNGITGGTITTTGTLGLTGQALALHNYNSNGVMVRTGASTFAPLAGTSSHTLAYQSGNWTSSSFLKTNSSNTATGNSKRVTINDDIGGESWPFSYNTATKFLVNGLVQMNSNSTNAMTSIMGRSTDDREVGTINLPVNSGLILTTSSGITDMRAATGHQAWSSINNTSNVTISGGGYSTIQISPGTAQPSGSFSLSFGQIVINQIGTYAISYKASVQRPDNSDSWVAVFDGSDKILRSETKHSGDDSEAIHSGTVTYSVVSAPKTITLRLLTGLNGTAIVRNVNMSIVRIH